MAGRYAAALHELADEHGRLDEVAADMAAIRAMLAESPDLRRLAASPAVGRDAQGRAIDAVLREAGASELALKFAGVVARNGRLALLDDMCAAYQDILARRRGEVTAEVATARPMTDAQRGALAERLRAAVGGRVVIDARVDAGLIGGMTVKIGSRMADSSVQGKLRRLELALKGAA